MATKVSPVANASRYDKTQKSGNMKSFIANIAEMLTSYKGSTKGGKPPSQLPGPGRAQAAKIAGRG